MRFEEFLARAAGRSPAIVLQVSRANGFDVRRDDLNDPMPGFMATARRLHGSSTTEACS